LKGADAAVPARPDLDGVIIRVLLRDHRDPASHAAWIVVILALPVFGALAYLLLGETNIGRRRVLRMQEVMASMPDAAATPRSDSPGMQPEIPERRLPLFQMGRSVSGFDPIGGNHGRLIDDSNAAIAAMIADIDQANHHVRVLFYIWMPDHNGRKMADALKRAVARGVACRGSSQNLVASIR